MLLAKLAATRSTCLSRPTGAVIVLEKQVLSTGYNGSMPGAPHCSDEGRCYRRSMKVFDEGKYDFCRSSHAEANAIAQAARNGIPIKGATIYCTLLPCYTCTKLLASAGIKKIVYELGYDSLNKERDAYWVNEIRQAGIELQQLQLSEHIMNLASRFISQTTSKRLLRSE